MRLNRSLTFAFPFVLALTAALWAATPAPADDAPARKTHVQIVGEAFHINDQPTYAGRSWEAPNGKTYKIEGLLMNARLVQGVFDDLNPETRDKWNYPDTGEWDPDRNTSEFVAAMPEWRRHGMLAFTLNLQGGSPEGYSRAQPWHNSSFTDDGELRPEFMARVERILDRADELGMVVMLGYFYFGQDQRLKNEEAVIRAVDNATNWLLDKGYRNVIVEVNNECNVRYDHEILQPDRVHELIQRVRDTERDGYRLYAGTSYGGGTVPRNNVIEVSDYLLLHGNGVSNPDRMAEIVRETRARSAYTPKPIVNNEDDHYDFDKPWNNYVASVSEYASWGLFDFRRRDEPFTEGFQSVPVDWGINSERKKGFFDLTAEITGH